jgi:DNA-binding NarL/FixJ family response regulator
VQATGWSEVSYDAVERALVSCLEALADLADSQGEAERVTRFLDAAEAFSTARSEQRSTAPGVIDTYPLTTREYEVAQLIARGLTNRQIGEELIISERTVDTHVQNILGKLELVSRAQVGTWIMGRRRASPVILLAERRNREAPGA